MTEGVTHGEASVTLDVTLGDEPPDPHEQRPVTLVTLRGTLGRVPTTEQVNDLLTDFGWERTGDAEVER
jgi:hypothetical protein